MAYDFINRLQKSLDDFYLMKSMALINTKEFGDIRELQGFIKAIKIFGDLISEANNPIKGKNK